MDIAMVLLRGAALDPTKLEATAAASGIRLQRMPHTEPLPLSYSLEGGGDVHVMPIPAAHPDAARMPLGVTSPSSAEIATADAHAIVTLSRRDASARERDRVLALVTAAVVDAGDAVGAMLGHGRLFHRADVFSDLAKVGASAELPVELAVDVTAAPEGTERMSFLTHGLTRYGREEFLVTCPVRGAGAIGFLYGMAGWMLDDPQKVLPTGYTVGRTAKEKIVVQRVPSPTGEGADVIRLDLP